MALTVLYFAGLRDLSNTDREQVEIAAGADVSQVLVQLRRRHERLRFDGVRCAVNEEFVDETHPLADGDTLALIPPVSGG